MQPVWRLLNSGHADGATNMAVDEAILSTFIEGGVPPTLRFFGWKPACLSLGYFQAAHREVDMEACREQGVDVVRRPTGGRAVLHDQEVTYSLVASDADPTVSGGTVESYRKISAGLLAGLAGLGIEASVAPPQRRLGGPMLSGSAACFDSTAGYELTVLEKKVVGSAQMRRDGAILQHGSILLRFDPQALFKLIQLPAAKARAERADLLAEHAVALGEVAGRPIEYAEVVEAMTSGFAAALDLHLASQPLSAAEEWRARQLRAEKYANPAWNLRR